MSLSLRVLGKSPAWPDAEQACSGYLVSSEKTRLLLDCGTGIVSQLRRTIEPAQLSAIFISHLHADHCFDLVPLAYLLHFCPPPSGQPEQPIPLWLPTGGQAAWSQISAVWNSPELLGQVFDIHEYTPEQRLTIGDLDLQLTSVPHYVPTVAVDIRSGDKRLTYGADCGPNQALPRLADKTPFVIIEATMPDDQPEGSGHLSARQAGMMATAAGAGRLMLTHFSEDLGPDQLAQAARNEYSGLIALAEPQLFYQL